MSRTKESAHSHSSTTSDEGSLLSYAASALWQESASKKLRSAWQANPTAAGWKQVQNAVASQAKKWPKPLTSVKVSPLSWGISRAPAVDPAVNTTQDLADSETALAHVERAYALRDLKKFSNAEEWFRTLDDLLQLAQQATGWNPSEGATPDAVLAHQLLAGELPLVLAATLPAAKPLRALVKGASEVLTEALLRLTDGEGLIHARYVSHVSPLLACYTRCGLLAKPLDKPVWSADAQLQYEWLVRQTLRLVDGAGRTPLAEPPAPKTVAPFWNAALELGGDAGDRAAAAVRLKACKLAIGKAKHKLPESEVNSEWSGLSVLSSDWAPKAPKLVVATDGAALQFELASGGEVLISGAWPVDVTIGAERQATVGGWDEQCWYTDKECDYYEVAINLSGGGRLERQFLLAKRDRVAYVAELLISGRGEAAPIVINTALPLAADLAFQGETETREGCLEREGKPSAGVMPLGLAEWRLEHRGGELTSADEKLVLTTERQARNVACPVWFDLNPKRFAKQRTWRQLTVAASLERVAEDVAVGYRVQSAKDQWLLYRSLDPPANRTVLGQNLSCEGLIGRFNSDGGVDEYFEIRSEDEE